VLAAGLLGVYVTEHCPDALVLHEVPLVPAPKPLNDTEAPEIDGLSVTVQLVWTSTSTGLGEQLTETLGACRIASPSSTHTLLLAPPPAPETPKLGE